MYHSLSPISKSKGVSILATKSVPWTFGAVQSDHQGCYLLLRGKGLHVQVTFANVYFPNVGHPQFLQDLLPVLLGFAGGRLVLRRGS